MYIIIFLIVQAIIISTAGGIFLAIYLNNKKYENFVIQNSSALKNLKEINLKYSFHKIKNYYMEHNYDNENFFGEISCRDYLTYQLVYIQKGVNEALSKTLENKNNWDKYEKEIKENCKYGMFGDAELPKNKNKLARLEREIIKKEILPVQIEFSIFVKLNLTNINGHYRTSKYKRFLPQEIKQIETRLNQKRGNFYQNEDIWRAICRVERGKVTNKMRFAIYERDHYRCRKCGRKTNDLEIDHIIPIAKGGKSTYDNLQTLCHHCNKEKGSKIE